MEPRSESKLLLFIGVIGAIGCGINVKLLTAVEGPIGGPDYEGACVFFVGGLLAAALATSAAVELIRGKSDRRQAGEGTNGPPPVSLSPDKPTSPPPPPPFSPPRMCGE